MQTEHLGEGGAEVIAHSWGVSIYETRFLSFSLLVMQLMWAKALLNNVTHVVIECGGRLGYFLTEQRSQVDDFYLILSE